jgi:hypothetical protein
MRGGGCSGTHSVFNDFPGWKTYLITKLIYCFNPVLYIKLVICIVEDIADSLKADAEGVGDLLIEKAGRKKTHDLPLAWCKREYLIAGVIERSHIRKD